MLRFDARLFLVAGTFLCATGAPAPEPRVPDTLEQPLE